MLARFPSLAPWRRTPGPAARPAPAGAAAAPEEAAASAWSAFVQGPWFAYPMLLLLQLRVVWGMWQFKDLTGGDTSGYFAEGSRWFSGGWVDIAWSPLYTAFYGSFLFLTSDIYTVTILHRLVIVLLSSVLVLAVLRKLLPPGLAWFGAAWWAVLPINFDSLYEVHQFALLPILAAWLVLLSSRRTWARGTALAVLAAAAVLVRNEMSVAVAVLSLCCLVREWRAFRRREESRGAFWRRLEVGYGVPLLLAAVCCYGAYRHSSVKIGPGLQATLDWKHTMNMAQVYSFGYGQRHPEWRGDPWTGQAELMRSTYGKELPTLTEMLRANPGATLRHFLWNWELVPNGVQLMLFNATSGHRNPDYVAVKSGDRQVLWLSLLVGACWLWGAVALLRDREFWWRYWVRPRLFGYLGMLALLAVAAVVITTQRPRPSYLFSLSVALIAVTGTCLFAATYRMRWLRERATAWAPVLMALVVVLASPYYYATALPNGQRPLRELVRCLQAHPEAKVPRGALVLLPYAGEPPFYLWHGEVQGMGDQALVAQWPPTDSLARVLDERHVPLAYFDEWLIHYLETERPADARDFLGAKPPAGWKELERGETSAGRYRLFARVE